MLFYRVKLAKTNLGGGAKGQNTQNKTKNGIYGPVARWFVSYFFISSIIPAEVQERGGTPDPKPIPGVVLVSECVLWVQEREEMGQAAFEKAQIVSSYIFLTVIFFNARDSLCYMGHTGHMGTACHYLAFFRLSYQLLDTGHL